MARIVPVPAEIGAPARRDRAPGAGRSRRSASMRALAGLAAAVTALTLGACAQLLGLEELSPGGDAGPSSFRVRGTAAGLDEAVSLRLEHADGSELLTVTQDGPFVFATELAAGAAYAVVLVGDPPCVLGNASGNAGTAPDVALACGAALLSLSLSGPGAPLIDFDPARSDYDIDVSLLQQSVQVIATAASPEATLTVDGVSLPSGEASAPLALGLGDNVIDILVSAGGAERAYQLNLRRGAAVAQHAYAKASNTGPGDELGFSLALSGDTLAVGAPYEDSPSQGVGGDEGDGAGDSGAVYVFRRDGNVWKQEAYLKASNAGVGDDFGYSVELAGDLLVVGAPYEDGAALGVNGPSDEGASDSGAAYVFRRAGDTWQQEAYLKASNTGAGDNLGWSVTVDGDTVAVGARAEDSSSRGVDGAQADDGVSDAGAVYVFRHGGNTWVQEAYVKASNTGREDNFGRNLTLHGDTLAVSARFEDSSSRGVNGEQENDEAVNSGAVYVFRRVGASWGQEAYLKASNTGFEDDFGLSLA
ncbi:MAG TPA: cadherin-like beta sandwich domain-containing protein, partial [Haliangium sp.]|nr:cadherin-like beta sandwich domain-containing protein [Haliangium sp.]